jgi:hypothetical protein
MAHYKDFTEYCYDHDEYCVPGTVNMGWLGASLDFEQMEPDRGQLDLVWDYCKISVAKKRPPSKASQTAFALKGLRLAYI